MGRDVTWNPVALDPTCQRLVQMGLLRVRLGIATETELDPENGRVGHFLPTIRPMADPSVLTLKDGSEVGC